MPVGICMLPKIHLRKARSLQFFRQFLDMGLLLQGLGHSVMVVIDLYSTLQAPTMSKCLRSQNTHFTIFSHFLGLLG